MNVPSRARRSRAGEWFRLPALQTVGSSSPSHRVRTRLFAPGLRACQAQKPGDCRSESTAYRQEAGLGRPLDFRLAVAAEAALQFPHSRFW